MEKAQLFRQLVYSFYEEAEFCRKEQEKADRTTQIRLTKQALRELSESSANPPNSIKLRSENYN